MSYMLIRLLQNFSSISLDFDAQPPESRPPASWANGTGRKAIEKFWPKAHLTMYSNVRLLFIYHHNLHNTDAQGGLWVKMGEAD